jgi:hypothetical protein
MLAPAPPLLPEELLLLEEPPPLLEELLLDPVSQPPEPELEELDPPSQPKAADSKHTIANSAKTDLPAPSLFSMFKPSPFCPYGCYYAYP